MIDQGIPLFLEQELKEPHEEDHYTYSEPRD
jgi:uncharacterized protein YbaR (Trm112 family)